MEQDVVLSTLKGYRRVLLKPQFDVVWRGKNGVFPDLLNSSSKSRDNDLKQSYWEVSVGSIKLAQLSLVKEGVLS